MAGSPPVRRLLVVNALIFAVLAAAVALAYYSYSYSSGVTSRERELQLMHDLAEEKVLNIESWFVKDERTLLAVDDIARLRDLASSASVRSVFVLDEGLRLVPDGYSSRRDPKEGGDF